jgi:opacity protein-like surface antigen
MLAVLAPRPAASQEQLRSGTVDVGLGVGASVSHDLTGADRGSISGLHLLAHLGYVATDERGPGILRGNLELLLEPTLIHLSRDDQSSTIGGVAALVRWIFTGSGRIRPYIEAGGGVLGGRTHFRETRCDRNFVAEGGPGVLVFVSDRVALSVGYRFQHISDADTCSENLGINSSVVVGGLTYLFP